MVNDILTILMVGYMIFAVIFYVVFLILNKQEEKEYKWRRMDDKVTEEALDIMKKNRKDMLDGM